MQQHELSPSRGFAVVAATDRSETATMVLDPGMSTGGPGHRHQDSDQWLYVLSRSGRAVVEGTTVELAPGSLLLIEPKETHQITNTGDEPLRTLNVHVPPEY